MTAGRDVRHAAPLERPFEPFAECDDWLDLSTQGPNAVNARDRIGKGPWCNSEGQMIARDVAHLHGDTLEEARLGNNFHVGTALNEKGAAPAAKQHDMLTGSTTEGKAFIDGYYSDVRPEPLDRTCNWS